MHEDLNQSLQSLAETLEGELYFDDLYKGLYATDASVYRMMPTAVAFPKTVEDIKLLIIFAKKNKVSIIPRTAGTSLAGQVVGEGIVVDVSEHFNAIISLDLEEQTVTVQPGVIRDDLNRYLARHGLFFGPNTSTSNRCMIGGMVGNNSSGTTSIKYGVTRDKVIKLKAVLSDASEATFSTISNALFKEKRKLKNLEGKVYKKVNQILEDKDIQQEINANFPKQEIHRRSTGYALDALLRNSFFGSSQKETINLCDILAGSEGTLAFTTEIKLKLDKLPPQHGVMVAAHFSTIDQCMQAVVPAMQHDLYSCEMMDKVILDCTLNNREHQKNRFFIEGDPKAILMLEVRDEDLTQAKEKAKALTETLQNSKLAYALPHLEGEQINMAAELRKAGLGLLGNIVGDRKAVACIEDTAVMIEDLAEYISEFSQLMAKHGQDAVYYAHAGAGEIHLRPILNLKKQEDVKLFRKITTDVAALVKKYNGSMSGEHGDGIVRAEFIKEMLGKTNYKQIKKIKKAFDPDGIFNPGKIVAPYKMDKNLRYTPDRAEPEIKTLMNFEESQGILRLAENCNGTGECRKPAAAGGTMCPSYRATKDEKDSTRGRANLLREYLTTSDRKNKFDHKELKQVFDLCISCKGCSSECPSNVDVAALKAEFEYQYKKNHGSSLRTRAMAHNAFLNNKASKMPGFINTIYNGKLTSKFMKRVLHIAPQRELPKVAKRTLNQELKTLLKNNPQRPVKTVHLFVDEFTNHLDVPIGIAAVQLLQKLNYAVKISKHTESGRSYISKGFLKQARKVACKNVEHFQNIISADEPLIGIEPSAILTFRDEYPRLVDDMASAKILAQNCLLIDEFLANEVKIGNIKAEQFTTAARRLKIHGHCHQKALSTMEPTFILMNLPENYKPTIIPSGCCGMAGSFGYEEEHYEISMKIGEQTLFPAVRKADKETIIVAPGTSCRHQIQDGTSREALHPVEVLLEALR